MPDTNLTAAYPCVLDLPFASLAAASYNPTPAPNVQRITFQDISADIAGDTIAIRGTHSFTTLCRDMETIGRSCVTHPDLGECQAGALAAALGLLPMVPASVRKGCAHSEGGGILLIMLGLLPAIRVGVTFDGVKAGGSHLAAALSDREIRQYKFRDSIVTDWPIGYQQMRPLVEIGDWCLDPVRAHSINRMVGWIAARETVNA